MINVSITGSLSSIHRHLDVFSKIQDVCITGKWISSGSQESAFEADNGLTCAEPKSILEKTDALIITDGGSFSNRLAIAALRNAKHVFLYPSVIRSLSEVNQLIKLAREANVLLKCGNTGVDGITGLINVIQDIDAINMIELQHYHNISNSCKSAKISEVLLSDMEIISSLIHSRNTSIKAKGLCMLTSQPEIINARLEFDNGCVVNYNCNLVSAQNELLISIILKNRIIKYNFLTNELTGWHLQHTISQSESPIFMDNFRIERTDTLFNSLSEFFQLIKTGPAFLSVNDSGFEPVILTDRILEKVMKTLIHVLDN
jgi:hypothetical protein